ncbi:MAG: thioredoxin family protein [Armatimonadetes bacterium]|nr:thioredoxin family protein [Armatimonadota bacterium]
MMFRYLLPFLCAALSLFFAGGDAAHAQKKPAAVWSGSLSRPDARPGEKIAVQIEAAVAPGYHIYSVVPVKAEIAPQSTEITVTAKGLTPVGKATEPTPKQVNDPNFNAVIGMHEGAPVFTQTLQVPKSAKPGVVTVSATVYFMACTDRACLPPKEVKVTVPAIKITAGAARKEFVETAGVPVQTATDTPPAPPTFGGTQSGDGLGAFLATAFGAGLIALATPCVFPLIPVTLAFFTKQATTDTGETKSGGVVKLAALYCLGIVVAFTAIGAVLSATVGAAGANRLASNPWVNLAFGVLFVVFALSLLEVIELKPPAFLAKRLGSAPKSGTTWSVLGMGLTFVVAAFTCTAPFIGTVLVAAASAQTGSQWVRPILGMTTFALALALPFFVFALFPSLLAKLPKSGAWLSTVKGAMGWIELAAAVKFLSNADQVFEWQLLNTPTILALWAIVFLGGGFWLLGVLRVGFGAPDAPAPPLRAAFAALFFAIGAYCVYGLTGRPLDSFTVAYLPPSDYGVGAKAGATELAYLPTLEAGIAQAKAENKPIFVDFTGYTCTNCRWMEKNVFVKPAVEAELSRFVRVRLVTDNRLTGAALQEYQEKTFGTVELPLYAVLDSSGKPVTKPVGKTDSPDVFAAFLRGGRETVAATQPNVTPVAQK